jgi:hypothetical protein
MSEPVHISELVDRVMASLAAEPCQLPPADELETLEAAGVEQPCAAD